MRADVALTVIERCAREQDVNAVIDAFLDNIRAFGFDACAAGAWVGIGKRRAHRFYFNNWPRDWFAIYEASHPAVTLTHREIDCMHWVAVGKSDSDIGQIPEISAATVHFHVERVKGKLNTKSRTEAVGLLVLAGVV